MKYATKFMITEDVPKSRRKDFVEWGKLDALCALGRKIGERHQFEEDGDVVSIELQVFSQKEWSEFKQELKYYTKAASDLGLNTFQLVVFSKMIDKLENKANEQPTKQ